MGTVKASSNQKGNISKVQAAIRQQHGQIIEISLDMLHPFSDHPFQVRDDDSMQELTNSIQVKGVLIPGIVRPRQEGGYEIIAGHRRRRACELAGLTAMPVIIQKLDDDEATIIMIDSNLQREYLLPSERAWAYRMKLEALNHRGRKIANIPIGKLSVDILIDGNNDQKGYSKNQIYRYIRLTELVPDLLDMVDAGRIAFTPAVELSYLTRLQQSQLLDMVAKYDATPSLSQAQQLKRLSKENHLTQAVMEQIISQPKKSDDKVAFTTKRLSRYFSEGHTQKQMEYIILKLLREYAQSKETFKSGGSA